MDYDYLLKLKQTHPTLRLLAADNAPLIVSFLYEQFIRTNQRSVQFSELISHLEDYLFHLRSVYGENVYPKAAKDYLADWSDERTPYLRKYYTSLDDEPQFDLTPATEKAIEWIQDLQEREFVGTESRLLTIFQLLQDVVSQTERDPEARVAELERKKTEIDDEIRRIRGGQISSLDTTQVRERFFQLEDTARKLLADFRQVEYNFRALDRATRERIATSDRPKGALLDEIFAEQDVIRDSDQGRSFRAFWEFLMSPERQGELDDLLSKLFELEAVQSMSPDRFLQHIRYFLLEAGEKVYQTNNLLVEQLRRYLDDQAWLENKRIMEIIKDIEKRAVEIKACAPADSAFTELDDIRPSLEPVMSRSLFNPPKNPLISDEVPIDGEAAVALNALFGQVYVDEQELATNVRRALQWQPQISLAQLIRRFPIKKGLAEVVSYVHLAEKDDKAMIDTHAEEVVEYVDPQAVSKHVKLPRVVFLRRAK
jgi:hypothetical protein